MSRDPSLIFRGVLRRAHFGKDRSSYPLVSGDTYKKCADYTFSDNADLELEFRKLTSADAKGKLFLAGYQAVSLAEQFMSRVTLENSNLSLIIHNWDNIPSFSQMEALRRAFTQIFSVNWLGDRDICSPIPIGLENADFWVNGVPQDYIELIHSNLPHFNSRNHQIFCNFSIATNPVKRQAAMDFFTTLPEAITSRTFSTPRQYREQIANTQFVVSPPGNGADCHRTWEAIYLGAVPIVLKEFWPFSHLPLPVIVVEEWADAPEAIRNFKPMAFDSVNQLKELFLQKFI